MCSECEEDELRRQALDGDEQRDLHAQQAERIRHAVEGSGDVVTLISGSSDSVSNCPAVTW